MDRMPMVERPKMETRGRSIKRSVEKMLKLMKLEEMVEELDRAAVISQPTRSQIETNLKAKRNGIVQLLHAKLEDAVNEGLNRYVEIEG